MSLITRPFKVLGIQQIAIGGPDKVKLQKLWIDLFGLEMTGTYKSDRENVDEDICAMGVGPFKVEVDLMQPIDLPIGGEGVLIELVQAPEEVVKAFSALAAQYA
jgi:hypothetical protein